MKYLLLAFNCCFFLFESNAQSIGKDKQKQKIDSVVRTAAQIFMIDSTMIGLSVGVIDGSRKYTYHYGETAPGSGILPTNNSLYEIGSLTKTFTGLLVAYAIKEGKMKLNEDIRKYLEGSYPRLQYPNGGPVKLGYVLVHTAQLPNSFSQSWDTNRTHAGFLQELKDIRLDTLRPFKYRYSNAGYQILGYMLEQIYSTSYENLLQRYITGPLLMSGTGITLTEARKKNLVNGYNSLHQIMPYTSVNFPSAGGIKSNVSDMLKYMEYQLQEKDKAVKLTHRIIYGDIDNNAGGFHWAIGKTWNWDYYWRVDGGTNGFRSFCIMYPEYDFGVILLSNETDEKAGRKLYDLAAAIFRGIKK